MIDIKEAEILDILPYTMKDKHRPLSLALKRMRAMVNAHINNLIFWSDIDNAPAAALDLMAAEVDAPFYNSDMEPERKRALIKAAYAYNSRIGTVSSITQLLAAAFGGGEIKEWHEYGGEPYHFKLSVNNTQGITVSAESFGLLAKKLNDVKPTRAKLDNTSIAYVDAAPLYLSAAYQSAEVINTVVTAVPFDLVYLTDVDGVVLTDEDGNRLIL